MRVKNSIKNTTIGMAGQIFNTIISFVSKTIFIYILGANYLGVSGLFSNVLSMLSLADLGVGSAIIYSMYKPLADNDKEKLKTLMKFYAKAYRTIGVTIGILGLILTPFLDHIIKDKPDIPNLTLIYLLFLANSVISYFYIYKSSLIIADEKNYIVTIRQQVFLLIQTILQSIFLIVTTNYIIYLFIQIIMTYLVNFNISRKADSLYPFLREKNVKPLDKESRKNIFKNISAIMFHKIGIVIVSGTDNILISGFVGLYWVGLYSNYSMIIGIINKFLSQIFTALTASVGNLNAQENKNKSYDIYKKIFFLNFWIFGFCSICLLILFNPFIKLWIGKDFIMNNTVVLVIVINFYLTGMRRTSEMFTDTYGLFWNDRYAPLIESIINLIASIILLKSFGVVGVFLGTIISNLMVPIWVKPYILYKYGFERKLYHFFLKYFKYTLIVIIAFALSNFMCHLVLLDNLIGFLIKLIICFIIINLVFLIFSFRTEEFKYFVGLLYQVSRKLPSSTPEV